MILENSKKIEILWLSPNLNHYKQKFLNHLHDNYQINLTILAGIGRKNMGDIYVPKDLSPDIIQTDILKRKFGYSNNIRKILKQNFNNFDWIMIPREKKNIGLILYALYLRFLSKSRGKSVKLFSYTHPRLRSKNGKITLIDKCLNLFFYYIYDRIIFYTEHSRDEIVKEGIINKSKAFFANNTIYTKEVDENYSFQYPERDNYNILFIGRLIENKKFSDLLRYFRKLKVKMDGINKELNLIIIGDGPMRDYLNSVIKTEPSIKCVGALVDESKIAPYMKETNIVFNPGHSGLSVNHAFCYGRPYITLESATHAPEINYVKDGYNGYILSGSEDENINKIFSLLISNDLEIYDNAYSSGKELSIDNWCEQIESALFYH